MRHGTLCLQALSQFPKNTSQGPSRKRLDLEFWNEYPSWNPLSAALGTSSSDLPGGPEVKNPPTNTGGMGSISSSGTKIPHAVEQLSHNYWGLRVAITEADRKSPWAAKKEGCWRTVLGGGDGSGVVSTVLPAAAAEFTCEGALYRIGEMPPEFWYWSVGEETCPKAFLSKQPFSHFSYFNYIFKILASVLYLQGVMVWDFMDSR